jgi:hypothetical protein
MIHVDGDDQRFGHGMAVRLAREDPVFRRKDDARELLEIGDVMCGRRTAADLHVVVVPLQQSLLIEVKRLLCTVCRDIRGEADFQTTPRFACFLPGRHFFGFNAGSGKEKWSIHIRPHRASSEVCELQITPGVSRVCPWNDDRGSRSSSTTSPLAFSSATRCGSKQDLRSGEPNGQ